MRVLLAEDERLLAEHLALGLRRAGMAVDVAADGVAALEKATSTGYDVLILDRELPGVHGDVVLRRLVDAEHEARVLMLTAAGDVGSRVEGLRLGADDYLAKPFDFDELVARVAALGRRRQARTPPVLRHGDVLLDAAARRAWRGGRLLSLSRKEFGVLDVLLRSRGALVSAEELLERVWDENADPFTSAVRVTMSKLRAKLGPPDIIETVPGCGYRLR